MDILKNIKKINKKCVYFDVDVLFLSNFTVLKTDSSKTMSERYRFLFVFVCSAVNI